MLVNFYKKFNDISNGFLLHKIYHGYIITLFVVKLQDKLLFVLNKDYDMD